MQTSLFRVQLHVDRTGSGLNAMLCFWWQSQVLVKVQVWDHNIVGSNNKIDFLVSDPPLSITPGIASWTNVTLQNRTTSVVNSVFCLQWTRDKTLLKDLNISTGWLHNWLIDPPTYISQSVNHSIIKSISQSFIQSVIQVNSSINQPASQSVSQSVNRFISTSVSRLVSQLIVPSFTQLVSLSVSKGAYERRFAFWIRWSRISKNFH